MCYNISTNKLPPRAANTGGLSQHYEGVLTMGKSTTDSPQAKYTPIPLWLCAVMFLAGQIGLVFNTLVVFNLGYAMFWALICAITLRYAVTFWHVRVEQTSEAPQPETSIDDNVIRDAFYRQRLPHYKEGHYVYLIRDASPGGLHKIGRTSLPSRRIADFDAGLPFKIHILAIVPCEDSRALERAYHAVYARKRVNGEWFILDAQAVAHIQANADAVDNQTKGEV